MQSLARPKEARLVRIRVAAAAVAALTLITAGVPANPTTQALDSQPRGRATSSAVAANDRDWLAVIAQNLAAAVGSGQSPSTYAFEEGGIPQVGLGEVVAYDEWAPGCFIAYTTHGPYSCIVLAPAEGADPVLLPLLEAARQRNPGEYMEENYRLREKTGEVVGWGFVEAGPQLWERTLQAITAYYSQARLQPRDDPYDIDYVGQLPDGSLLYLLGTWGMWGSGGDFPARGDLFPAIACEDASGQVLVSDWGSRSISPLSGEMAAFLAEFKAAAGDAGRVITLKDHRATVDTFLRSWLPSSAGYRWLEGEPRPSFDGQAIAEFPVHFDGAEDLYDFWGWVIGCLVCTNESEVCVLDTEWTMRTTL